MAFRPSFRLRTESFSGSFRRFPISRGRPGSSQSVVGSLLPKRLSPPLTSARSRWGPFVPRALPRFPATMRPADSRHAAARLCLPVSVGFHPHAGAPRFLGQSFGTRSPQSPRQVQWLLMLVASPPVAGFSISGRLANLHACDEAESGSLALQLAPSPPEASSLGSLRSHQHDAPLATCRTSNYMAGSFHPAGLTSLRLAHQRTQRNGLLSI